MTKRAALRCSSDCAKPIPKPPQTLAAMFRGLAVPIIGRIEGGALILDLRTLRDDGVLASALSGLGR